MRTLNSKRYVQKQKMGVTPIYHFNYIKNPFKFKVSLTKQRHSKFQILNI